MRRYHDGDWQGSRKDAENRSCPVYRPGGYLLHLRLPELQQGGYRDARCESTPGEEYYPR